MQFVKEDYIGIEEASNPGRSQAFGQNCEG